MHTPTPWTIESDDGVDWTVLQNQVRIAVECSENNARLIAAAPELLAVLREAFRAFSHDDDGPVWADSTIAKARAAIAKATGGAT